MFIPRVLKDLIMEFCYDFNREYRLAVIRLIGRENAEEPDFKVYTEPLEFGGIIKNLQKYGVDLQTIHGAAFVARQSCNDIIQSRGNFRKDVVAKTIFERVMKVPHKSVVCMHQADVMVRAMRAMVDNHMDLSQFRDFDWVLNRQILRLTGVYGLLS